MMPYDYPTNPAERWLNARQDLAEAKALGRKGPLFERAAAGRAEEAQRRMDAAMSRMEREGKSYDLWGTGVAIVPVPDDHFAYRPLGAR